MFTGIRGVGGGGINRLYCCYKCSLFQIPNLGWVKQTATHQSNYIGGGGGLGGVDPYIQG